jgi:nucleoside-diphosphate-sugar epimerase
MNEWPQVIRNEQELDEVLCRPWPKVVEFIGALEGDILILGAGGKMGPTLIRTVRRAAAEAGVHKTVLAVGRGGLAPLEAEGISTVACDLSDPSAVDRLPRAANVIFMVGRKFGSVGNEPLTWMTNVVAPYHVARTFTASRIVAFSTGGVYPIVDAAAGGATEETPPDPVGEYYMSCLGRERMFDYFSRSAGEKVVHLRLNYAVEMRYGVLVDVATKVWNRRPVDVTTGWANVIWQGDACNMAILCLQLAVSPAVPINVTGPGMISIRETAETFGRLLGREPVIAGRENGRAYLASAAKAHALLGLPRVPLERVMAWTAEWVRAGGRSLGKPTHFEVQDGKY